LVIDPERFPDDREVMNKVGMGAVYSKGTSGEQLRAADFNSGDLLERYFHPYSIALSNLVSERLSKTGYALIIDVHSYRPQQHPNAINHGQMRPSICMGTDKFHTPDWLKTLFLKEFKVLGECLENQPYSGSYIPLEFFERDERVWSVMLEARSDTFLDYALKPHQGLAEISGALARFISSAQASAL
jgi:N-formylglutamate amidohydrolase